ncbi:MAG: Translation initiation factor IF-2 [Alphaproteobacteria bacterium MarineAlpha11_Bin1]|nr:MAG: Translation initiation factor IF-2 [Alphaproteobacteria bacterium MarineAlpha11_Bin1]|tara:strand:+ start:9471 stop:12047 length:2577 start_codon:yes stop_codon:yes gene_type:complete
MTDQKETDGKKKKLSLSRPGKLELNKTVDAGQVRQSFSHGRTKSVSVEVRRKRTFKQADDGAMTEVRDAPIITEELPPEPTNPISPEEEAPAAPVRTLTDQERATRMRALEGALQTETDMAENRAEREAMETRRRDEEKRQRELEEERRKEEEVRRRAEDEERRKLEEEASRRAKEQAARLEAAENKASDTGKPKGKAKAETRLNDEEESKRLGRADARKPATRRGDDRRRGGKLTISQALNDEERQRSLASVRRRREREKRASTGPKESVKVFREVTIPETITVQELANRMTERAGDVIKALMSNGIMATITETIDAETAELLVTEFGHTPRRVSEADVEIGLKGDDDEDENLLQRPPVVTIMGHVDHGKTSLLDALRASDVAAGEAGGITQHIGAYQVEIESGDKITFLDTPGHEAFTSMRSRGANATDIVVLVVAADDGIMPQTVEAIDHARAAEVPIIVAINKIDRPDADADRVRNELLSHELVVESMGGDVLAVEVSALEKTNLDKLMEAIVLQAEILEIKANPDRNAEGVVVEAKVETGRGSVATVLVKRGTLKVGEIVVAGAQWGKVRALLDYDGKQIKSAGPSTPAEILGLGGTPDAGDEFSVVENEARAREITEFRRRRERDAKVQAGARGTLDEMFSQIQAGEVKEIPIVVKADVQGSVEAIVQSAQNLSNDEVSVRVLHTGVGGINESDITLAKASNAMMVGFNVRANAQARQLAEAEGLDIRYYAIIYDLVDDLKSMLTGMLAPQIRETFLGNAAIKEVFTITKVGRVAGCEVTEGVVRRGSSVRLLRDDVVIHEGTLSTLKRFKDEVREVTQGFECGMAFENYQDIKDGDVIECFDVEEIARTLD